MRIKTEIRKIIGTNNVNIDSRLSDCRKFTMGDVDKISKAVGCDPLILAKRILFDIEKQRRAAK
jgi:hypothetical protein